MKEPKIIQKSQHLIIIWRKQSKSWRPARGFVIIKNSRLINFSKIISFSISSSKISRKTFHFWTKVNSTPPTTGQPFLTNIYSMKTKTNQSLTTSHPTSTHFFRLKTAALKIWRHPTANHLSHLINLLEGRARRGSLINLWTASSS